MVEGVRYQVYETSDHRHVLFMASEQAFWKNFCEALDRMDLFERWPGSKYADHARGNRELRSELRAIFATKTAEEWLDFGGRVNTPIAPVNTPRTLLDDPQFADRFQLLPTAEVGADQLFTPLHFVGEELPHPAKAPTVGQHSDAVLRSVLGYDDNRIAAARDAGAFGTDESADRADKREGVMERVRLGVLGAGNIAVMNVRGYLEDPRCDVVAVCDSDEEVGRQAAKEWGAESFHADLSDMLADDSIDAVEVLTPTHLHHDHVIAALEAGKHVSVQKPVANSVEDALEMQAVADRVGRILRISECFVHYPPLELAKRLVADGAIGKPTSLRIRTLVGQTDSAFQAALRPEGYGWRLDKRSPGGHLFDDMVHKYAMALWLLDLDITSVQAVVRRRDLFFEPCAVIFEYEDPDVLGMMEVQYSPNFYMRSSYYGADEILRDHRRRGADLGDPCHRGDARPRAGHAVHRHPARAQDDRVHRPGRRLGRRLRALLTALRRRTPAGEPGRHDGRRGDRRPAAVLRGLRGGPDPVAGRSPHRHRDREPPGLGGVVAQGDPLTPREAARRRSARARTEPCRSDRRRPTIGAGPRTPRRECGRRSSTT